MEISSTLVSSSVLKSPFSDQSHLQFYHSRHAFSKFSFSPRLPPPRPKPALVSLDSSACVCILHNTTTSTITPTPSVHQASLMQELTDLKILLKQKKRELKAHLKEEKKGLKITDEQKEKGRKGEAKKLKKTKKMEIKALKSQEKEMKMSSSESSSSTSSESTDCELESMSMSVLRQGKCERREIDSMARVEGTPSVPSRSSSARTDFSEQSLVSKSYDMERKVEYASSMVLQHENSEGNHGAVASRCGTPYKQFIGGQFSSPFSESSNKIEVCAGGKCKKAGSEQLLLALRGRIPAGSNVEAVPCKCMGKCGMAMNVRVHREDTNPQHHSHVRVEDANFILSHHFDLGRPTSGLPVFPSMESRTVQSPVLSV